jgi:hypothetical protein
LSKKIQSLASRLSSLAVGERVWFWYSAKSPELPLLLEKFSDKNGMARLNKRATGLKLETGALVSMGIAVVTGTGELQFGSSHVNDQMLPHLASWVGKHVASYPALAHLSGAKGIKLSPRGKVLALYDDNSIWDGIPRIARPGSLGAHAAYLSDLEQGENAWIWMSEGASAQTVAVVPISSDPDATEFGKQILSARRRSGVSSDPGIRGTVRRIKSGSLLISTNNDLDGVGPRLSAWLGELGEVLMVKLTGDEITEAKRIGGSSDAADLSTQVTALEAIDGGATYLFWFSDKTKDGSSMLILEESRGALKARAMEVASDAPSFRGQVLKAKWGLEFRSQKPAPDFLEMLAGWVSAHHDAWPALLSIVGARMTVRNKSGDILERYKDSNSWAPLRSKEN